MWKSIWKISLIVIIVLGIIFPSFAQAFTIASLIEQAKEMDGQAITLEGEVIGDVMFRKDMAWMNISDETGAIGVWINADEAKKITILGDYKHQGDTVRIKGIFHRAFEEQGGEMAIAGESLQITLAGENTLYPIQSTRLIILGLLAVLTASIYLIRRKSLK